MDEVLRLLFDGLFLRSLTTLVVPLVVFLVCLIFLLWVGFRENRLEEKHKLDYRQMWRNHWGTE